LKFIYFDVLWLLKSGIHVTITPDEVENTYINQSLRGAQPFFSWTTWESYPSALHHCKERFVRYENLIHRPVIARSAATWQSHL